MTVTYIDLDGTLVKGSAAFAFARKLRDLAPAGKGDVARFTAGQLRMVLTGSEPEVGGLAERALVLLKGLDEAELKYEMAENGLSVMHGIEYARSYALVEKEKRAGNKVVLATAAPEAVAEIATRWFNFDEYVCTKLGVDEDGKLDGTFEGELCHGEGKANAVRKHAEENGVNLEDARAMSDSYNDLPLLRTVGHPVAVNPDSKLRAVAKENGWELVETSPRRSNQKVFTLSALGVSVAVGVVVAKRVTRG